MDSESVKRVQRELDSHAINSQIRLLPDLTRTAQEAASALGCAVEQIGKSVVFKGVISEAAIVVILSGSERVSQSKVEAIVGEGIAKADAAFVREKTGYVIGGVSPLGLGDGVKVLLDTGVFELQELWVAAGTPHAVVCVHARDIQNATSAEVGEFSEVMR